MRAARPGGSTLRNAGVVDAGETSSSVNAGALGSSILGVRPPRRVVGDIYARSEGNAFFTDYALPTGLTSLLLSRTRQLSGIAQQILAVLAVAARPLDEAGVALLCQRSGREVREALRDLRAQWLLRRPDAAGRHQLRHALLGEAVSGELLPSERAELHARVADAMVDWHDPSLAAHVAGHLAAAGRPAEELRWRVRAGRHADAVFAAAEAAQQWQRALALSADAPINQVVEGMSLAELYGAAEDALALTGGNDPHATTSGRLRSLAAGRSAAGSPGWQNRRRGRVADRGA
jgi:hypothetical protein